MKTMTIVTALLATFLGAFYFFSARSLAQEETNKKFLMRFMKEVLAEGKIDEATISHYLHRDFVQLVDGKKSDYQGFIKHMKNLHSGNLTNMNIRFEHVIAKGDQVVTVHYPTAYAKDGSLIKFKVIALFGFKDGKIILCDELTYLLEGDSSFRNVGSH